MGGSMAVLIVLFLSLALLTGCNSSQNENVPRSNDANVVGEYIYRMDGEHSFDPAQPLRRNPPAYPWDAGNSGPLPKLTKEYFRCKGSSLNPVRIAEQNGKMVRFYDCGGVEKHSLSLKDGKEFVYPILIQLVNYIQTKTGKKVVITSGHRCPEHNSYVDAAQENQTSKHMIGAEVSFYVQSLENNPDRVVKLIQEYYTSNPKYKGKKDYLEFKRYEKNDTNVSTQPWYNKEVFIKLFKKKEGRDFDNRHPYPYISIQVRYDEDKREKVVYDWNQAYRNYLRY